MKTIKSFLLICLLLFVKASYAQTPPVTIHVETAGTLPTLIAENQKYEITDLTLTGNLNGTDIRLIREMTGTGGKLAILNLEEANIVAGGDSYYEDYYTITNQISDYMFYGCSMLKTIILPKSVISIGASAFRFCTGLTTIIIPDSVTSIGNLAFWLCTGLTSVTIGNSVTSIGGEAFAYCSGLTSITIPNSVTTIEFAAFQYCTNLTNVVIGNNVTTIGGYAFRNCTGLTTVTIGNSVTLIGSSAFQNCSGLTDITIPNNVTEIGTYAFMDCTGLISVIIGNSVTSIGWDAFRNCTGLTNITIPNSVTWIGYQAFLDCTGLTRVTIGNNVTSIGWIAFAGCTRLTEIHSNNPVPPSLGENCFSQVNKTTCKLYVPKGSKNAYQSAPQWQDFINIEENDVSINTINKDDITVQTNSNGIIIETKEQTPVSIYNLSGQKEYQSVINGNVEIALNKGIYILQINNESKKVMIK